MSSSSEDSDVDDRFKDACHPLFSSIVDKKLKKNNIETPHSGDDIFEIVKILKKRATCQQPVINSKIDSNLLIARNNSAQKFGTKTPYDFVSKKLQTIISEHLQFIDDKSKKVDPAFLQVHEPNKSIKLINDIDICATLPLDTQPKRKSLNYQGDEEKILKQRCKTIALSPERILQKIDVPPWPHPKNIRYLDEYIFDKMDENGKITAKLKKIVPNVKLTPSKDQKSIVPINETPNMKRKQSRQRGKKKKKDVGTCEKMLAKSIES